MSDTESKTLGELVELLDEAGIFGIYDQFESGHRAGLDQTLTFDELGIDSLSFLVISVKIEERFSVSLSPEKIASMENIGDLLKAVVRERR